MDNRCLFTRTMQRKKIEYLEKKGGEVLSVVVKILMPDWTIATVDEWGRVTWNDQSEQEGE